MEEKIIVHPYKNTFVLGNTEFSVFCDKSFLFKNAKKNDIAMLHNHFFNEILIIDQGEGVFEGIDKNVNFKSGSVFYIPKNIPHLLKSIEYKYFSIGFTFKKIANKNKLFNSYDNFLEIFSKPIFIHEHKEILSLSKNVFSHINKPSTFSYYTIQALIQKIIVDIAESGAIKNENNKQISLIADFDFTLNQRINDLADNSKFKDIANDFFISERQLSRIIKKQYGVSFIERKNQLKIESAKQLLKNSQLPIDKIAKKVYFHDTRTFVNQFIKRVGVSPIEYRDKRK